MAMLSQYFGDELNDSHKALVDAVCLSILADGKITKEEEEVAINFLAEMTELETKDAAKLVRSAFERISRDSDEVLQAIPDKLSTAEEIEGVFFAAAWVQYMDGEISTEEDSFLYTLADVLGLDDEEVEEILAAVEENIEDLEDED